MDELIIRGPSDCEDSNFSASDTEAKVLFIPGVYEVFGKDGAPLEVTDEAEVVADKNRKDHIEPAIRRLLGINVKYHWVDPKYE